MIDKKIKKYMLNSIFFMSISLVFLITYLLIASKNVAIKLSENTLTYVSYEVLTDNVVPVMKDEIKINNISRPYKDENVTIGLNFYDSKDDEKTQEKSITYYEGTYIQNKGIDYVSENTFKVYSILDGKVISITEDDINGKTIKIEHSNNLISIYQSVDEILVSENDTVSLGEEIAQSSTNKFNSDLGNHLHFELYSNNEAINPEEYFNKEG